MTSCLLYADVERKEIAICRKENKMKKLAIILTSLALLATTILTAGCSFKQEEVMAQENQTATVQRGSISTEITAAGNLALSDKEELAFEVGGTQSDPLSVEEVLVEEGDTVKKGQVLARLDTSAWQDRLDTLQNAITTAERQQTAKERALTAAERQVIAKENALTTAESQIPTKEFAVRQAELSLKTAEYNLSQLTAVKAAQNAVDGAQAAYDLAQLTLTNAIKAGDPGAEADTLMIGVIQTRKELTDAQNALKDVLSAKNIQLSTDTALELATRELAVEQARRQVQEAQTAIYNTRIAVTDAKNTLDDAKDAVTDAQTALDDAIKAVKDTQETLDEERAKKTEIIAPFDGFVTAVNVEGGDEISKGTVACVIADPNKFQSYVMVSEMDISQVKVGGDATISVDSLGGLSFPAKVTHIAPTATVQSGVVNFKVKVVLESIEPTQTEQGQAVSEDDIQLKEGLTVTVSIIVQQKSAVLLVPSASITTQSGQSYVQVLSPNGTTEKRAVKTGVTDYQRTEIVEGLTEGETVIIPRVTSTGSKTTTTQQQPPGGMMIPGIGGGGPPSPGGP